MGVEVGEERPAVHAFEARAAVADGFEQSFGGVVVDRAADAHQARHALELLAERREREAPILLGDHVLQRQPSQHARERGRIGADGLGHLGARQRSIRQRRADAELRRDVQQLRHDVAVHQAQELPLRFDANKP